MMGAKTETVRVAWKGKKLARRRAAHLDVPKADWMAVHWAQLSVALKDNWMAKIQVDKMAAR